MGQRSNRIGYWIFKPKRLWPIDPFLRVMALRRYSGRGPDAVVADLCNATSAHVRARMARPW